MIPLNPPYPPIPATPWVPPLTYDLPWTMNEARIRAVWGVTNGLNPYVVRVMGEGRWTLGEYMVNQIRTEHRVLTNPPDHTIGREGFLKAEYASDDTQKRHGRKFCLVCGCGAPKAVTGEWYHWNEHPQQCRMMGELAIRTIVELIRKNDVVVLDLVPHYPNEFQQAAARLLHELECKAAGTWDEPERPTRASP